MRDLLKVVVTNPRRGSLGLTEVLGRRSGLKGAAPNFLGFAAKHQCLYLQLS